MSLTLSIGQKMLREIVGGNTSFTASNNRFLGLSATKPSNTDLDPTSSGRNFNITEPPVIDSEGHQTNYERVRLVNQSSGNNNYFTEEAKIEFQYDEAEVESFNYNELVANGLFTRSGSGTEEDPYVYTRITSEPYSPSTTYYVITDYEITIANDVEIHFHEALADWGIMKYFVIFTSLTGLNGDPIYFGELIGYTEKEVTAETFITDGSLYTRSGIAPNYTYTPVLEGDQYDSSVQYYQQGVDIKSGTVPLVRAEQLKISVK